MMIMRDDNDSTKTDGGELVVERTRQILFWTTTTRGLIPFMRMGMK